MWRSAQYVVAVVVVAASASCDGSSPTSPSDVQGGQTTSTGQVRVTVSPNPVPFSGSPVTDAAGCAGVPNTWFYEQTLEEIAGANVTFTHRIDSFDGVTVNNLTGLSLVVPARGTLTLRTRWCSGNAIEHRAQSSFSGTDANGTPVSVAAPVVRLMAP